MKELGNGKYQLAIDEIKENDTGEYMVQISSNIGTMQSKANISLKAGTVIISRYRIVILLYAIYNTVCIKVKF